MKKLTVSAIAIAVTLVLLTLALALPAVAQAPGDANDDGDINAGDITKLERIILGWDAETPGADANEDGTVNASDIGTVEYMTLEIWPWDVVHIEAPDNLPYCTHFTATMFVTYLDNFGAAHCVVQYDPTVLELEGVTDGSLQQVEPGKTSQFYTVNSTDWSDLGGAVLINSSVDGNPGVSGAGYLAKIKFHVIGSQGESTDIDFNTSESGMIDRWGAGIDATWAGDIFNVSAGGPTATATPTQTPGWELVVGQIRYLPYNWSDSIDIFPYDVWGSSSSDVYAVGLGDFFDPIWHYNGSAWSEMSGVIDGDYFGIWGDSSDDIFVVGAGDKIIHYNGSVWSNMNSGTSKTLYGVWGSSSTDIFAVGPVNYSVWGYPTVYCSGWDNESTILHYNGSAWSDMDVDASACLYSVWGTSTDDVFAVGTNGTILHYNGTSWSAMASGTTRHLEAVWGTSPTNVYAVGAPNLSTGKNEILRYNGSVWSNVSDATSLWLHDVWGTSASDVFAVGWYGRILHYDGSSWIEMSSGTLEDIYRMWGDSPQDIYAVGPLLKILHYGLNHSDLIPPAPTPTSSAEAAYHADRQRIWEAVIDFSIQPTNPALNHVFGEVPVTDVSPGASLNASDIYGSWVIPGEIYYPIAVCPLLNSSLPPGLLGQIPLSTNSTNCDCSGANAEAGVDATCVNSSPGGHYVWYTTSVPDIVSLCYGAECIHAWNGSLGWSGYQGVYP